MTSTDQPSDLLQGAPLSRAVQLVGRLAWLYGIYLAVVALLLALAVLPGQGGNELFGISREFLTGGLGETTLAAVLLAWFALVAAGLLTNARLWRRRVEAALEAGEIDNPPPTLFAFVWHRGPGFLARQGQVVILTLGFAAIALFAWLMWPKLGAPPVVGNNANLIAALIIGLAFPSLIAERMMHAFPAAQAAEAPGLRRILLIVTVILAVAGLAEIGRGLGYGWTAWVQRGLSAISLAIAAELAIRALARLFLPEPEPQAATAATDSIVATILVAGPSSPGVLIRTHLGLDFARSWALQFLVAAAIPALVGMVLFSWMLTGVKLLGPDQRGVYERFGAPVAVLKPGFHILLPWPMGRLRPVDYGTIHTLATGIEDGAKVFAQSARADRMSAEAIPTATLNRMWETKHATEAEFLVASLSGDQQSFQVVHTEILVLYRTGMSDAAAKEAVYGADSQGEVIQREANRLVMRYFSSHTLDGVMGERRENLQEALRGELATAVARAHVGAEIVAVLINEIHPPAGAAPAYHHVQAAGIEAETTAKAAQAHAVRTLGTAQQEVHQIITDAEAGSVERMQGAIGDAAQFNADRQANALSPGAFLFERRTRNLTEGLRGRSAMIVDRHLSGSQIPMIDLRNSSPGSGGGGAPATSTTPYVPDLPKATSTSGPAPE